MADDVEICNAAIDLIGGNKIDDLAENSKEARLCNRHYERTRKYLLRTHPWGFAKARIELAASSTAPAFGYTSRYQLPSDWIRNVEINGEREDRVNYKVEGDFIAIDAAAMKLVYIRDIEDPQEFDAGFTETFVHRLAYLMAYPLTQSRSIQSDMMAMFRASLSEAKAVSAQDNADEDFTAETQSKWLNAREA